MAKEKKPLRINIDMDGVVVFLLQEWLRRLGDPVTVGDITSFDWYKNYQGAYELMHDPSVYLWSDPIRGALEGVRHLNRHHRVKIVTHAPNIDCGVAKWHWLQRWLPEIDWEQLVFCPAEDKHRFDADILIDDNPYTLASCVGSKVEPIGLRWPYNDQLSNVYLANSWTEIVRSIDAWDEVG